MKYLHSGICKKKKGFTCNKSCIGQIGRNLMLRFHERIRYIRSNKLQCGIAMHVRDHQHLYGSVQDTVELIISAQNGAHMNCLESYLYTDMSPTGLISWRTKCRHMKSAARYTRHLTSMHMHVRLMSYRLFTFPLNTVYSIMVHTHGASNYLMNYVVWYIKFVIIFLH
jgi:hypothetical protein